MAQAAIQLIATHGHHEHVTAVAPRSRSGSGRGCAVAFGLDFVRDDADPAECGNASRAPSWGCARDGACWKSERSCRSRHCSRRTAARVAPSPGRLAKSVLVDNGLIGC
jgi:hypothetical protein